MDIKRCKLSKKVQRKWVECLVLEVPPVSQPNCMAFNRIQWLSSTERSGGVAQKLEENSAPFAGEVEVDESFLAATLKAIVDAAQREGCQSLVFSSAAARCIQDHCRCLQREPDALYRQENTA